MMIINKDVVIFDFNSSSNVNKWYQTNDNVMGGVSNSKMALDKDGNGVFSGTVSLENNGGFAMTRLPVDLKLSGDISKIVLFIQGDGKQYQLRLKSERSQSFWYIHPFETSTKKQQIEIPLKDFYPSFRGNKLNLDNFSSDTIKEVAILIGNKKNESFELVIDKIILK